jgi:hypothetical protein
MAAPKFAPDGLALDRLRRLTENRAEARRYSLDTDAALWSHVRASVDAGKLDVTSVARVLGVTVQAVSQRLRRMADLTGASR